MSLNTKKGKRHATNGTPFTEYATHWSESTRLSTLVNAMVEHQPLTDIVVGYMGGSITLILSPENVGKLQASCDVEIKNNETELVKLQTEIDKGFKKFHQIADVRAGAESDDEFMSACQKRGTKLNSKGSMFEESKRRLNARNKQLTRGMHCVNTFNSIFSFLGLDRLEIEFFSQMMGDVLFWSRNCALITEAELWDTAEECIVTLTEATASGRHPVPVFHVNIGLCDHVLFTGNIRYKSGLQPFRRQMTAASTSLPIQSFNVFNANSGTLEKTTPFPRCVRIALQDTDIQGSDWSRSRLYERFSYLTPCQMVLLLTLNACGRYVQYESGYVFSPTVASSLTDRAAYWRGKYKAIELVEIPPRGSNKKVRRVESEDDEERHYARDHSLEALLGPSSVSAASAASSASAIEVDSD